MSAGPIDLDCNATTRPLSEVVQAMTHAMRDLHHNPSSLHKPGQSARAELERARAIVAELIHARPDEIVFTASATESIVSALASAVRQYARSGQACAVVTSKLEHAAVIESLQEIAKDTSIEIRYLDHNTQGSIDVQSLESCFASCEHEHLPVAIATVHAANNETGVVQPVREIAEICAKHNVLFHTDATQLIGKLPCDVQELGVDMLSFSAHKFHGPRGAGAMYVRKGMKLIPFLPGAQESGRRGGTENVPACIGASVACDHAKTWLADSTKRTERVQLREHLEQQLKAEIAGIVIHGGDLPDERRLWNTVNAAIPGAPAEQMLVMLSEQNICASAGAACSSGSIEPSRVISALGLSEDVLNSSIRFSFDRFTTKTEIDRAVPIITSCAARLRSFN